MDKVYVVCWSSAGQDDDGNSKAFAGVHGVYTFEDDAKKGLEECKNDIYREITENPDYDEEDINSHDYDDDFAMETELGPMLNSLIALYLCYEIKICEMNSYAAENVVRQQITRESLKKIDELEEEKAMVERKTKKQKDFQKIIENYRKGD